MSQGNPGGPPKGKGGTVMISQSPFAQPGAPQPPGDAGGYGAPPAQGGFGAPPPQGGFGAPPPQGGFGAPPPQGGFGAPPGAPQGGFGAPAPGGFGGPPGAMTPAPMGGALSAPPGEIRNPTTITLITLFGCGVGAYYGLHQCRMIEGELKKMLGKPDSDGSILWYFIGLIPILSMPALIAEARARVGAQTQGAPGLIGYLFAWFYLIPQDANEIFQAAGRR